MGFEVKPLFKMIYQVFALRKVYADGDVTTAYDTSGWDDGSGVMIPHAIRMVYAKEIEFKALPLMQFRQFATMKTELGRQPGDTISMITYDNIQLGGRLKENVPIKTQAMSNSEKFIKVFEHGNAISMTELLLRTSFDDCMSTAATLLARDYALTMDCELRDTALSGTNVVYAADGTTPVTSRAGLSGNCILKVSTIKDAIEVLATNNTEKFNGIAWICFVHPHQSRSLRDDPAWINASNYGAPEHLFTGEIGRIDDTRFIETTNMTNGVHTENPESYDVDLQTAWGGVYQALLFGDNYYGLATALAVEMRDNGVEDFGRKRSLAWYSIFGSGLLNEERGVVIESA